MQFYGQGLPGSNGDVFLEDMLTLRKMKLGLSGQWDPMVTDKG